MSDLDLVTRYQIDYQTAEAPLPALETNLAIAEAFDLKEVHIPASDYEQGILQDLAGFQQPRGDLGPRGASLRPDPRRCAINPTRATASTWRASASISSMS